MVFYGIIYCAISFVIVACNDELKNEAIILMSQPIKIPSMKMDRCIGLQINDSTKKSRRLRVLYYIDSLKVSSKN